MKTGLFIYILIAALLLTACFPVDEQLPLIPFKGVVGSASNSIYTHQTFYSLKQETEVAYSKLELWDLGFECGNSGENIVMNSGKSMYICNIGKVDFINTNSVPNDANWIYDASSGNPDSLAINNWVNTQSSPYEYSEDVFAMGYKINNSITPTKKIKIIELTDTYYKLVVDVIEGSTPDTMTINKDNTLNYIKYNFEETPALVNVEPISSDWDIQFTKYATIIPDDSGILTPYVLNGAFINNKSISVAIVEISTDLVPEYSGNSTYEEDLLKQYFEEQITEIPDDSLFSLNQDAIGWEWKKVTIDEAANTAVYKANTRLIYIIKELSTDKYYKLRFFSYLTDGVRGYPWFQYIEM